MRGSFLLTNSSQWSVLQYVKENETWLRSGQRTSGYIHLHKRTKNSTSDGKWCLIASKLIKESEKHNYCKKKLQKIIGFYVLLILWGRGRVQSLKPSLKFCIKKLNTSYKLCCKRVKMHESTESGFFPSHPLIRCQKSSDVLYYKSSPTQLMSVNRRLKMHAAPLFMGRGGQGEGGKGERGAAYFVFCICKAPISGVLVRTAFLYCLPRFSPGVGLELYAYFYVNFKGYVKLDLNGLEVYCMIRF
jgi:hypothetical protein